MNRMRTFSVWAPNPESVEIELAGRRHRLQRDHEGTWSGTFDDVPPDAEYGFIVDGEGPFPDPRSPRQRSGVHGLSTLVDHAAFPWTDAGFQAPPLSSGLIYELHIGTFTPEGTFDAAIERLDHLRELGVTHVEIMPVNAFSGTHGWGYDGVSLFAPHEPYGGPDGLKRLVDACHRRGLAVILDVVYNHLGPSGNYLPRYGPYFSIRHQTPWGSAVNFDGPFSDHVRRFFCDNALMWLRDYHFDGLRLDAVHAIVDVSAIPFLEQLSCEVHALEATLGRHLVLIAESDLNDPRLLWPRERGGFGLHAQWSDDFHHALHSCLTGERSGYYEDFGSIEHLARALRHGFVYDGRYAPHRRRSHGRSAEGLTGHRFLGYLQNHDQVGNRAAGERISHLVDPVRARIGAALVLTSPFVPMLFMGEEWGASTPFLYFTSHPDPELGRAVSEGRKREFSAFGWNPDQVPDPQIEETFLRSKLDWNELAHRPHADLLEWHRRLVALRRSEPALLDGRMDLVRCSYDEGERWLVVERGPVSVACNFDDAPHALPLREGSHKVLLASAEGLKPADRRIRTPGPGVVILRRT